MNRILVVDDTDINRRHLEALLVSDGFEVDLVNDGESALVRVAESRPALVLLDLRMPGIGGMATLDQLKVMAPALPVIVLTAHAEVGVAVEAIARGASDFLVRPIPNPKLLLAVRQALQRGALEAEVRELRARIEVGAPLDALIGESAPMREATDRLRAAAGTSLAVLIRGEPGTGRALFARAIHHLGARRAGPLVALDCGALPPALVEAEIFGQERAGPSGAAGRREGQLRLAEHGTLFLDEIDKLPPVVQARLARALQGRRAVPVGATRPIAFDVRIIAATAVDLDSAASAGRFDRDLYYRLAEFTIELPSLRERTADIPAMTRRFVEEAALELRRPVVGVSAAAVALLQALDWPSNVPQLRNVVRQAVLEAKGPRIEVADLRRRLAGSALMPEEQMDSGESFGMPLRRIAERATARAEERAILVALRATAGNKSQAARLLQVDYKTLNTKMRRYRISAQGPFP